MNKTREVLSRKVIEIKPSGIRTFFDIVRTMEGAISLGVGEPDFDTPWSIREEGIYSLERGRTFYTSNSGLAELREEITHYMRRRFGVSYDPDREVIVTVGGSEGIDLACRAMLNPGDEVIIPQPSYVSYEPCAILAGATPVVLELKEKDRFKLTAEELEKKISKNTKLLILPFPNNPTGSVMSLQELRSIAELVMRHDLYVVSDEIYTELTYTGEAPASITQIPGMRERTIVINGFSKAYAMTGWRLGYACGPAEILQQMVKIHQFAIMCAPTTSQYAAVRALRDCDEDIARMREAYNQRRRYLLKRLEDMGIPCFEPEGAFYIFPNIQKFGLSSEQFCRRLLQEEKVAVVPGNAFGESGEGFVRISYAYSLKQLKEAMERMERFTKRLEETI
ncbi:aromatic amino acid aminotransferase [Lachnospiraceae bacterium]|nr:aromatic amino acid aminotransferase [Lachnospiraceae bacterium]